MGERSALADFKLKGKLGSGTYGTVSAQQRSSTTAQARLGCSKASDTLTSVQVWKVVRKIDNVSYALKEITLTGLSRRVRGCPVSSICAVLMRHQNKTRLHMHHNALLLARTALTTHKMTMPPCGVCLSRSAAAC